MTSDKFLELVFKKRKKKCDGGIESLTSIIKHYKGHIVAFNFTKIIDEDYYQSTSLEELNCIISNYGLIGAVCIQVDIPTIIEYNQPIVINIASLKTTNHFVVCHSYTEQHGFYIIDPINDPYYASIAGLKSIWLDKKCLVFVSV
ncbi:cysteine peptidase family C39 domain-containing protein [Flavobacterium sp.]|uniref:cysteine peptidase family C39 domain-containing protein n=1 Tax=Flavobacterium sp. TaxID=239 RepID=UPI003752D7EE